MQTTKIRHQFYLPDDLLRALDELASKPAVIVAQKLFDLSAAAFHEIARQ